MGITPFYAIIADFDMPRRPRSHQLEELSRDRLHTAFGAIGWTVEDLHHDYGEDLLVRIFEREKATRYQFFVQAKATDHIERYLQKDGRSLSYPVSTDHVEHWRQFWEPVILAVWDAGEDITYWECVQTFLDRRMRQGTWKSAKTIRISIPKDNILNEKGLRRVFVRTRSRFERFEREREGGQVLVNLLEEKLHLEIEYAPQFGILIVGKPGGEGEVIAFGRFASMLEDLHRKYGVSPYETFRASLDLMKQIVQAYQRGETIALVNEQGTIEKSWPTLEELRRHVDRWSELNEGA